MTVDHRPYLRPGTDLCTAEDVAEWLRQFVAGVRLDLDTGMIHDVNADDIAVALRARLDRERVQACRRGALAAWRAFRRHSGWFRDRGGGSPSRVFDDLPDDTWHFLPHLTAALAFRAAARAK